MNQMITVKTKKRKKKKQKKFLARDEGSATTSPIPVIISNLQQIYNFAIVTLFLGLTM